MSADGFKEDLSAEQVNESHARLVQIPNYIDDPSLIDEAWREIRDHKPVLRHEIARIAIEYGGGDAELRAKISMSLLSLYVVLRDAAIIAEYNKGIPETVAEITLPFDQDAA